METHRMHFFAVGVCLVLAASAGANVFSMGAGLTSVAFVTIGDPGNNSNSHDGYGSVAEFYDIARHELTSAQYAEFLNAVAATDAYGLYNAAMWSSDYGCKIEQTGSAGSYSYSVAGDRADRPVNFVSWGDAARFTNWLVNGQPTGVQDLSTTEDGVYFLDGATTDVALLAVTRKAAQYFIPSENEWYKAAYYDPDYTPYTSIYYDYPTNTNAAPSNDIIDPDPGNNANYFDGAWCIGSPYWTTEVGEFENSDSPWGTLDQGGNVREWNEAVISSSRGVRGGCFGYPHGDSAYYMLSAYRQSASPTLEDQYTGFRVAQVPEPCSAALMLIAGGLLVRRRRTDSA